MFAAPAWVCHRSKHAFHTTAAIGQVAEHDSRPGLINTSQPPPARGRVFVRAEMVENRI